jgi:hypothetical protein
MIAAGIATITQHNFVAPQVGTHKLKECYEERLRACGKTAR